MKFGREIDELKSKISDFEMIVSEKSEAAHSALDQLSKTKTRFEKVQKDHDSLKIDSHQKITSLKVN